MRDALVLALLGVMWLELAHVLSGVEALRSGAHLAMGLVVLTAIPRLGLREAYLMALSGILAGMLWAWHESPWETARVAMDQAVFLMAFVLLISLVQEGAMTSRSVVDVGLYLALQPGGRRYAGLYSGTMLMGVVFNLGTMSLLAPLIRRAREESPDDPLSDVRERRQLNAMLRGFAWCVIWSPTAIAPLALMELIDGIDRPLWMVMGFAISVAMLGVGWAEDRIAWRGRTARALGLPPVTPPPLPVRGIWRFLAVCVAFAVLTVSIMALTGLGIPPSLMASAPLLLIGWLWVQGADLPGRLAQITREGLPATAPAAVTLAGAGFIGIAGAALIPAETIAEHVGLDAWPAWAFMLAVTLAVVAFSQFALSPVMMAVFFGAILGSLPSLPADPTLTALSVAAGWSVSTTISPFASGVILLTRITGHPGTRLTYCWNPVFTALSVGVLAVAYFLLTGGR